MMLLKRIKLFIIVTFVVLLSSCVPPHVLYLRNFLTTEISVVLSFRDGEQLNAWTAYRENRLLIRKNVNKFNKTKVRSFKDTIKGVMTLPLTMQYTIPPKSVVLFGNSWYFYYDKVDFSGDSLNMTFFPAGRYLVDNITGNRKEVTFRYKWLGNYFFDISN